MAKKIKNGGARGTLQAVYVAHNGGLALCVVTEDKIPSRTVLSLLAPSGAQRTVKRDSVSVVDVAVHTWNAAVSVATLRATARFNEAFDVRDLRSVAGALNVLGDPRGTAIVDTREQRQTERRRVADEKEKELGFFVI